MLKTPQAKWGAAGIGGVSLVGLVLSVGSWMASIDKKLESTNTKLELLVTTFADYKRSNEARLEREIVKLDRTCEILAGKVEKLRDRLEEHEKSRGHQFSETKIGDLERRLFLLERKGSMP